MLDIASLERRWLRYKIKHYLPIILLLIMTAAISIVIIYTLVSTAKEKNTLAAEKVPAQKPQNSLPQKIDSVSDTTVLEPSMQFMQSFDKSPVPDKTAAAVRNAPLPSPSAKQNIAPKPVPIQTAPQSTAPIPSVTTIAPLNPSVSIKPEAKAKLSTIKRDNATLDIHEVEGRFLESSNPNLGLFIARYHYDHGNYTEAYNYALKTNAINSSIDESWLIFAKSLVKLGKTDQARKTLQLYISKSNSESAKNLLDTLNKDKTQ